MANIRKRPVVLKKDEEINTKNVERIFKHMDDSFIQMDERRIVQQSVLADDADAATVRTALIDLINNLNASDLTEE